MTQQKISAQEWRVQHESTRRDFYLPPKLKSQEMPSEGLSSRRVVEVQEFPADGNEPNMTN
jgi:hypothetical protein